MQDVGSFANKVGWKVSRVVNFCLPIINTMAKFLTIDVSLLTNQTAKPWLLFACFITTTRPKVRALLSWQLSIIVLCCVEGFTRSDHDSTTTTSSHHPDTRRTDLHLPAGGWEHSATTAHVWVSNHTLHYHFTLIYALLYNFRLGLKKQCIKTNLLSNFTKFTQFVFSYSEPLTILTTLSCSCTHQTL